MDKGQLSYDPIRDEFKEFTLAEWLQVLQHELNTYVKEFEGTTDFYRGKHTWSEWLTAFNRYMSW